MSAQQVFLLGEKKRQRPPAHRSTLLVCHTVNLHMHIVNLHMHMHKYSPEMCKYWKIGPNMANTWPQRAGPRPKGPRLGPRARAQDPWRKLALIRRYWCCRRQLCSALRLRLLLWQPPAPAPMATACASLAPPAPAILGNRPLKARQPPFKGVPINRPLKARRYHMEGSCNQIECL